MGSKPEKKKRLVKDDFEAVVEIVREHNELRKRIMAYLESKIPKKK